MGDEREEKKCYVYAIRIDGVYRFWYSVHNEFDSPTKHRTNSPIFLIFLFFTFDKFSVFFSFDRIICHARGRKMVQLLLYKMHKDRIKNAHNIAHKTTQDRKTVAWNHSASSVYTLNYCETAASSWTPIRWLRRQRRRRRRWRLLLLKYHFHAHIGIRHTYARARTLHTHTHTPSYGTLMATPCRMGNTQMWSSVRAPCRVFDSKWPGFQGTNYIHIDRSVNCHTLGETHTQFNT